MTRRSARACGVALAEIRRTAPNVNPDEFKRRAFNYRMQFKDAALTPSALCSQWAACDHGKMPQPMRVNGTGPDGYTEPQGWRDKLAAKYPDTELNDKVRDGLPWLDVPKNIRQELQKS
jgi:hypothetical protein